MQEQLNRRTSEISAAIEPLSAKLASFLAQYCKQERLAITVGLAPTDVVCYKLWAIVLYQEQTAVAGLRAALNWEDPKERTSDPIRWEPRMVVHPMEISGFMEAVREGRSHTLPKAVEMIGA
jgi:hypothetical protein